MSQRFMAVTHSFLLPLLHPPKEAVLLGMNSVFAEMVLTGLDDSISPLTLTMVLLGTSERVANNTIAAENVKEAGPFRRF